MHSHSYRDADSFKGKSVLVIGCGASGLDISFGASKVADKVTFKFISIIKAYLLFINNLNIIFRFS